MKPIADTVSVSRQGCPVVNLEMDLFLESCQVSLVLLEPVVSVDKDTQKRTEHPLSAVDQAVVIK